MLKGRSFVHVIPENKIYRLEDLTPEQREKLNKNLNEQASRVPLRLKEEKIS